ncbi:hypothetical protein RI367_000161 [Sorochytrium milnesiophthora]
MALSDSLTSSMRESLSSLTSLPDLFVVPPSTASLGRQKGIPRSLPPNSRRSKSGSKIARKRHGGDKVASGFPYLRYLETQWGVVVDPSERDAATDAELEHNTRLNAGNAGKRPSTFGEVPPLVDINERWNFELVIVSAVAGALPTQGTASAKKPRRSVKFSNRVLCQPYVIDDDADSDNNGSHPPSTCASQEDLLPSPAVATSQTQQKEEEQHCPSAVNADFDAIRTTCWTMSSSQLPLPLSSVDSDGFYSDPAMANVSDIETLRALQMAVFGDNIPLLTPAASEQHLEVSHTLTSTSDVDCELASTDANNLTSDFSTAAGAHEELRMSPSSESSSTASSNLSLSMGDFKRNEGDAVPIKKLLKLAMLVGTRSTSATFQVSPEEAMVDVKIAPEEPLSPSATAKKRNLWRQIRLLWMSMRRVFRARHHQQH